MHLTEKNTRLAISNLAFIDGQNLHLGTKEGGWAIDHRKLRVYLKDKYHIIEAYYFLGSALPAEQDLYDNLEKSGYILSFREHPSSLRGRKKGNVDSDIIFSVMKKLLEKDVPEKIYIISGDGDYKKLVDFLINRSEFGKMLFPNKKFASSLYNSLRVEYFDYLDKEETRAKIEYAINKKDP